MMTVPALDLRRVHKQIEDQLIDAVTEVVKSGRYILGPEVSKLERAISDYLQVEHCVAVGSGTDALTLALMATGIGSGCEVITTPFSFFATVESILAVGAKPVFVDIDAESFCINPEFIERAVTLRTSAILPVHIFGHPAEIKNICKQAEMLNNVYVIEDCAQAFGAKVDGRAVGSFGDLSAFSFYPTKNLGALGDGGCITTNYDNFAEAVRRLRNHGQSGRYKYETRGLNSRLDEIQAALLNVKLKWADKWNEERRILAKRYNEMINTKLKELVKCPTEKDGYYHVYHQYAIRVRERDRIAKIMREEGIEVIVHYPQPLHLIKPLRFLGYSKGDFPQSEKLAEEVLCLPIFPGLTEEEQDMVTDKLKFAVQKASGAN